MKNPKEFERRIANRLKVVFGEKVRRGLQFQDGDYTPDIVGTPFYIECKSGENYMYANNTTYSMKDSERVQALFDYYYQRMMKWRNEDGGQDLPVVIIWKYNRKRAIWVTLQRRLRAELMGLSEDPGDGLTTMDFVDFCKLLQEQYGA